MNDRRPDARRRFPAEMDLEAALHDLGGALASPLAPDLAEAVRMRVERLGPPAAPRSGWLHRIGLARPDRRPASRRIRRSLVLAVVAVLIVAGIAGAIGYGLPGLRIVILGPQPTASPGSTGAPVPSPTPSAGASPTASTRPAASIQPTSAPLESLGLGDRIGSAGLDAAAGYHVLMPSPSELGQPLGVFLRDAPPDARISVAYRATPTIPAGPAAPGSAGAPVAILITESPGRSDAGYLRKTLPPGTTIESVDAAGHPGLWISGELHELAYFRPDDTVDTETVRLVGNVLAWNDGQLTIRIEGAPDLATAQRIAASMR